MTAAVPQANISATAPLSIPASTSAKARVSSRTSAPSSRRSWRIDERVQPAKMLPVSFGVRIDPSDITTKTFMPPSSSMFVSVAASRNMTSSYPPSCAIVLGKREEA